MLEPCRRKPHEENLSTAHLRNRDAGSLAPAWRPLDAPYEGPSRKDSGKSDSKGPPIKRKSYHISPKTNPYHAFAGTRAVEERSHREDHPCIRERQPLGRLPPGRHDVSNSRSTVGENQASAHNARREHAVLVGQSWRFAQTDAGAGAFTASRPNRRAGPVRAAAH